MNYKRIYDTIIERSPKKRPVGIYTEGHHIIPRCMGGTNKDGIVYLSPEEHYLCHQLLVKMYPDHPGILCAASLMCTDAHGSRVNNKLYGWLKRRISDSKKGKRVLPIGYKHTLETIEKMRLVATGYKHTEEAKKKMSLSKTGVPHKSRRVRVKATTEETRQKMRDAKLGKKRAPHTEETRQKIKDTKARAKLALS
jgi:hypothetical protein